jgi:glyoxylase-like metal-dependent hydrolase (beta-lactamase superfamily II)
VKASKSIESERDVPFERVSDAVGRIGIPLDFFSVPVNVWVILADEPMIVDTGPRTDLARDRVEAGLRAMGKRVEELGHIFVTHHHIDHSGLLHEWIARSKATALVHEDDFEAAMDITFAIDKRTAGYFEVARRWGMSREMADGVAKHVETFRALGGITPLDRGRKLVGEKTPLGVPGLDMSVLHVPGHTEGQAILWDAENRWLYAGDHLLERITPNPNVYVPEYRGRWTGLGHYMASIAMLRELPRDTTVLPGHGASFQGLHERLDEIEHHHRERRTRILAKLEEGPKTVIEVSLGIWKNLGPGDVALAAREVHGHLDLLVEAGLVAREDAGEAWKWRRVA